MHPSHCKRTTAPYTSIPCPVLRMKPRSLHTLPLSCILLPLVFLFKLHVFRVCACAYVHAMVLLWRSEDTLEEPVLSFYRVGPRDRTQAVRLDSTYLYLPNHLASLILTFYFERLTQWPRLCLNSFNPYHHGIWDPSASASPAAGCTDLSFCKTESVYPLHTTRHYPFSWSLAVTVSMILSVPVIPTTGPHFYILITLIFHLV